MSSNTPKIVDLIIYLLLIVANLFWLPSFGVWKLGNLESKALLKNPHAADFSFPEKPLTKMVNPPNLSSEFYILVDLNTNSVITGKNTHIRIYPASITKLATAITSLNVYPLDEVLTIDDKLIEGKNMELIAGEKITVRSLISALLVHSANDAAYNLAKSYPSGETGFVREMNRIAEKYNLKNTHFVNYDGIHDENHYSTVYDLAQLGRLAFQNQIVRDVVKQKSLVVSDISGKNLHSLETTNEMLGVDPEIEGLKTGWTPEAGDCFIGLMNINGHRLISVVAQSENRFDDTRTLLNWSKQNVTWVSNSP